MHFAWEARSQRHFHQRCWEVRALISLEGCILVQHQTFKFAQVILRESCASYGLALREYVSHNLGGVNIFIFSFYHHFGLSFILHHHYHFFKYHLQIHYLFFKNFHFASAGAVGKPLSARPSEVLFAQGPISLGQMVPCYENRLCQS